MVLIPVPLSTTHPNGVLLCDPVAATSTQVVCETRAHCAANADESDPLAARCQYTPTSAVALGPVTVAVCSAGLSDLQRLRYDPDAAAARRAHGTPA